MRRNPSKSSATQRRRSYAIRAYVGANGHGKSLAMVNDTIPSLLNGRPVLSNVRLLDFENPRPCDDDDCTSENHDTHMAAHPLYVPLVEYAQLLDWRNGDILLDEVTGIASSRESGSLPFQVANLLVQLRRRDVMLSWTAPSWARADKILREVSQLVVFSKGYRPKARKVEGDETRLWRDRRLFWWRSYDATLFEEFTAGKREKVRPLAMQLFHRPGSVAMRSYDTLDDVSALGWALESGLCITCGGRRAVPRCSCPDHSGEGSAQARFSAPEHLSPDTRRLTRAERREAAL